jgi:hypothetical protein
MANDAKLRELILYVADASLEDPDFGMTKLNKVLFNADFTAYGRTGQSITEQDYTKQRNGPTVRRMLPAINDLAQAGDAVIKQVDRYGYKQKRVIALREPDLSLFNAEEISLIDESINVMRDMNAVKVSDLSHEFPGWKLVDEGQRIPYESVFLSDEPPTDREMKRGWELSQALL